MSAMVLAAALGPIPPALSRDLTGQYSWSLWFFLCLPICSGLAVLTAKPPNHKLSVVSPAADTGIEPDQTAMTPEDRPQD